MWNCKQLIRTRRCAVFLMLSWWLSIGFAQEVKIHQNYTDGVYSVRWIFKDSGTWQEATRNGLILIRRNLTSEREDQFQIKNETDKYLTLGQASEDERFLLAFLMQDRFDHRKFLRETFDQGEIDLGNLLEVRQVLCDYILNTNYKLIMESGFGFRDTTVMKNQVYEYKLMSNSLVGPSQELASIKFKPALWEEHSVPDLEASWGNKRVELKWQTKDKNSKFYAYHLERSEGNKTFKILDSLIMNPMDTSDLEVFHYVTRPHILENNDSIYTFKLSAYDFLGLRTKQEKEVSGRGRLGIGTSPLIEKAELLDNNKVNLEYSILEAFIDEVEEWRIYVGEAWDGPYTLDTSSIKANVLKLIRPLPFEDNYFRVVAVDHQDLEHSSFPMLVTHLDTTPPSVPTNLVGNIDSSGIVNLNWSPNVEKDFYGYKVFYGFDTTREMTLAHPKAIPNPKFTDTIGLKSLNRKLYYKVTAIDHRNNRSEFSSIFELQKPDIIAPMEASFYRQKSGPGQIDLAWYPSTSKDLMKQQLFRRAIQDEENWSLIKEWNATSMDTSYLDTGLEGMKTYAYVITYQDSSKNTSLPSAPAIVRTLPIHNSLDLKKWGIVREGRNIIVRHNLSDPQIYQINIYKQIEDEKPFKLRNLNVTTLEYIDRSSVRNKEIKYFIQVVYNDGFKSPFSSQKSIIID